MKTDYRPELDLSKELDDDLANRFQQMIGILRWALELGRVDIITEVTLLSSHNCSPRAGHLEAAYQVFEYLSHHDTGGKVVFNSIPKEVNEERFFDANNANWKEVYGDVSEDIPTNMPEPRGEPVGVTMFVDAAFAGDPITRRSHTGVIIFINNAPIYWYSKRQATVEASTFGSEFVALRVAVEMNDALRYKLQMMGFPIANASNVMCDNKSVVSNVTKVESTLKKKHLSVAYHKVRESCAKGAIRVAYKSTGMNLADTATKVLPPAAKRAKVGSIVY